MLGMSQQPSKKDDPTPLDVDPTWVPSENEIAILFKMARAIAANATAKGFKKPPKGTNITQEEWDSAPYRILRCAVMTANQHGETSELWEAGRAGTLDSPCDKTEKMIAQGLPVLSSAEEELADIIIRALDMADLHKINVARAVSVKMAYNTGRPLMHGNKLV